MFDRRIAWIAVGAFAFAGTVFAKGCSGANEVNEGTGICGNGIVETNEACDDGNAIENDGCHNCLSTTCGDGSVQEENGEQCDDGNSDDNDACSNNCLPNADYCGNGTVDDGEDCDDGNTTTDDECTNSCTEPRCGDGIVQAGEECDDGNNELQDDCPPDCMQGGEGGNDCEGQAVFDDYVNNDVNPDDKGGAGIPAVWSYAGEQGVTAGDEMCAAIGADHVCSWAEVVAAENAGELSDLPDGLEFWVHRITETVERLSVPGENSPPGPGGRCNDWTYPTNHISDGEFGYYHRTEAPTAASMARQYGNIYFFIDDDTDYEPLLDGGANNAAVGGDHACDLGIGNAMSTPTTAGCAGSCGDGVNRKAILCCHPVCVE